VPQRMDVRVVAYVCTVLTLCVDKFGERQEDIGAVYVA